jgi:palmitoyltransferase ZDHHC13/17
MPLQSGGLSLLTAVDRLGNTPYQCAVNAGHRMLAHFLRVQEHRLAGKALPASRLWRALQRTYFAPVIWAATLFSIWAFHARVLVAAPPLPAPLPWMSLLAMASLLASGSGLVLMALLNASDPGYVPQRGQRATGSARRKGGAEAKPLQALSDVENLDCPALWDGRWEQLCVSCKIVRPLRAKHEENVGRCIEVRTRPDQAECVNACGCSPAAPSHCSAVT